MALTRRDKLVHILLEHVVVAIDGPAGAGKSTIARRVAERLAFVYIDTGAMYRAVALWALRLGIPWDDEVRLEPLAREMDVELGAGGMVKLNGEDVSQAIRTPDISQGASRVSSFGGVRRALVAKQQELGRRHSVVMEGRDIGTVVFPAAQVKVFLDASPKERARRRVEELRLKGIPADPAQVEQEIQERDQRDSSRAESPLKRAPDAVYVDTTGLTLEQVEQAILDLVQAKAAEGRGVQR
jgi:cytidylate kinase